MTELRLETLTIPGARLGEENPLPFFREPEPSRQVKAAGSLPAEKRRLLGYETGFRVLPYRMQDAYTRRREDLPFRAVVLENEVLKATFLPELGGRLISLIYKPAERELLHRNPVFQPANLAIRNAWFSGGVEWNIGQYGHTFTTCSPLFAGLIRGEGGEPGLRLYEYERCKGLFWQIDFYLPQGSPFLAAYTRVVNLRDVETSMYWWTNVAVDERPGVRVLAPAAEAIYIDFGDDGHAFGSTRLPGLPSLNGEDGTYSTNSTFANEFFFQCDEAQMPWEAALDEDGAGFVEVSTPFLRYRKLFCWGQHAGGRHWQEFLSQPGQAYLEIQAGLAPTQVHGLVMPARAAWDWCQLFGYIQADPGKVHGADWPAACCAVESALKAKLTPAQLGEIEAACRSRADIPPEELLQTGSGWGALEAARRSATGEQAPPPGLLYPPDRLGPEQRRWLDLLEKGSLPEQAPASPPGEWMTQPEWKDLLEKSALQPSGQSWFSLLHLGVMRLEAFDEAGAAAAWEESLRLRPSAWAYRNLAVLRLRQKDEAAAAALYEQAWNLSASGEAVTAALAAEYLRMLIDTHRFTQAMQVYRSLPAHVQSADRVQILLGQIALELGHLDIVDQVLEREYAVVREGETVLTDLWFELHARRRAAQPGAELTDALRRQVRADYPPPARIDFRSFNER